ncbi:MAG TPA: hypothetical protein VMU98_06100 [Acidimicrobiales bacterium]|nr:hypothetical protein [Acidimicrobiales bacterium]
MRRLAWLVAVCVVMLLAMPAVSPSKLGAATPVWQSVVSAPGNAGAMFLMTNGQVLVSDQGSAQSGSPRWWLLTPSSSGSYVDGTWSDAGSLPGGYSPVYFASGVLPDGKLIIEGGEFNGTSTWAGTNLGAIYDPVANSWTAVAPPDNGQGCWANIADAPSAVLANGTFLLGDSGSRTTKCEALFNESTMSWTTTGAGKADPNPEEGFTLLPNGNLLDVNTGTAPYALGGTQNTEVYDPTTGTWTSAGNTPQALDDSEAEIGPVALMPSGQVFAEGATGATALFDTATKTWSAGPMMPTISGAQLTATDSCSAVLPDGNVLFNASPDQKPPTAWFTFNGTAITPVANDVAMNPAKEQSNYCNALVLPTGQVLVNDRNGPGGLEVYNQGGEPQSQWLPQVTSMPSAVTAGSTYTMTGSQFSGLDQGSYFGDDLTNSTNYPLLQITNLATQQVVYARTFGFTSMSIAPGAVSSSQFVVPNTADNGAATARVIVNGIASAAQPLTISGGVNIPSPKPKPKKTRILCVRGHAKRSVFGVTPRCPKGFTKK